MFEAGVPKVNSLEMHRIARVRMFIYPISEKFDSDPELHIGLSYKPCRFITPAPPEATELSIQTFVAYGPADFLIHVNDCK